jgi:hypothetical protein
MIHFPTSEMRAADVPILALPIRSEDESPFARADQNSNFAHKDDPGVLLPCDFVSFPKQRMPAPFKDNYLDTPSFFHFCEALPFGNFDVF